MPAGRKRLENFLNLRREAHIKHPVGLVKNDDADVVKAKSPLIQVVNETAGRRDDNVGISRESVYLRTQRETADKHRRFKAETVADASQGFVNLKSQFARRKNHKSPSFYLSQPLNHRDSERQRFAGAGLRDADDVLALDGGRNRLPLDGRRR